MTAEPSGSARFRLDGVTVERSDRRVALRDVTTTFGAPGVTALVGPSGAGKSTLLRLCNRLEVPTVGSVRYDGVDLDGVDVLALRRRVGMVFQQPTPLPGTVRDNLLLAVEPPGADDGVLAAALERVGLRADVLDLPAQELSGGEAQRVCLARALLTEPDSLLLDEPTSALDPDNRRAIEDLAVGLASDGVTVIWVTHDLDQADRIGDHRLVLVGGRVASDEEARGYLAGDGTGALRADPPEHRHGE